jgi:4-amino-4-deoxy-L-arabinose transferase-like glycosyltransferase
MRKSTWYFKDVVILTLLIALLFGIGLNSYSLEVPDSARYAEIPREMLTTHDYITPHLNYVKYFEKPPLFYWLQTGALKIFGINEFGASFVNALMGLLTCLMIYFAGCKLFGRLQGIIASCILTTSALFFALTHVITLDMTLTFFLTASLLCFIISSQSIDVQSQCGIFYKFITRKIANNKILETLSISEHKLLCYGTFVFAALAMLTKGLIGVVFPALIILTWLSLFKAWRNLKSYHLIGGVFLFLLIVLPWHILIQLKNPEFFHFYFLEQHFLRYLTPYASRQQPAWFFPIILLGGFYPWTAFLYQAIKKHIVARTKVTTFLLIWPTLIFIFYTFSDSKLIPYLLPILPPLALLVANYFAKLWHTNQSQALRTGFYAFFFTNIALGIVAVAAIYVLDFSTQSLTISLLERSALLAFLGSLLTLCIFLRFDTAKGFFALCIAMTLLLLSFSPAIVNLNNKSSKPLITILQKTLKPQDEVISFGDYYQDMPFYLQRRVTVVNGTGELLFGTKHQDASAWIIDTKTFWKHWQSKNRVYMIINQLNFKELMNEHVKHRSSGLYSNRVRMHIMARYFNKLLVVNRDN